MYFQNMICKKNNVIRKKKYKEILVNLKKKKFFKFHFKLFVIKLMLVKVNVF